MAQATTADPVRYSDGWLRYDIDGGPFFINASPKGTSFHVMEAGASPLGMALDRGRRGSLSAARKFAATLAPSTTGEILDRVAAVTHGAVGLERVERLRVTGEPGTRLWVLPPYGKGGYKGLGQAATSLGLDASGIEALFGTPETVWGARYQTDDDEVSTLGGWVLLTLADARERWWVIDGRPWSRNLLTGGHPDMRRMQELAAEFPNDYAIVVQGRDFMPEA
jgi:hypothetical protein